MHRRPVEPRPDESPAAPLVVRPSGGANCSSVGSVVDLLFVAGTLGGALLVAVTAALDELSPENNAAGTAVEAGAAGAAPPPSTREGEGGQGGEVPP